MSRKQPKRRAGNMVVSAIAGIFIVAVVCGVGLSAASADSSDDLARAGGFGFDSATQTATAATQISVPNDEPAPQAANASSLAEPSQRTIDAGLKMIDEREKAQREREAAQREADRKRLAEERKAQEERVDMIGLSGLITPSLEEMVNVAHEMERAGLDIPIMIGGATTSELHVALKIAPVYGGPVVWMKDASQNALVAARLMDRDEEQKMEHELDEKYEQLRADYQQEQQELLSLEEARKNKPKIWEE